MHNNAFFMRDQAMSCISIFAFTLGIDGSPGDVAQGVEGGVERQGAGDPFSAGFLARHTTARPQRAQPHAEGDQSRVHFAIVAGPGRLDQLWRCCNPDNMHYIAFEGWRRSPRFRTHRTASMACVASLMQANRPCKCPAIPSEPRVASPTSQLVGRPLGASLDQWLHPGVGATVT